MHRGIRWESMMCLRQNMLCNITGWVKAIDRLCSLLPFQWEGWMGKLRLEVKVPFSCFWWPDVVKVIASVSYQIKVLLSALWRPSWLLPTLLNCVVFVLCQAMCGRSLYPNDLVKAPRLWDFSQGGKRVEMTTSWRLWMALHAIRGECSLLSAAS